MKTIIAIMVLGSLAHAVEPAKQEYTLKAPVMTKIEAVKLILRDEKVPVYRCTQVVLNDKMSLVNKKKK
jgi:hypothetical protein